MQDCQLDLFKWAGDHADPVAPRARATPRQAASDLDDAALVEAIPRAARADYRELVAEAMRRRLAAAVPALEGLCRHFTGLGRERAIPEQEAALAALAEIGGAAARDAVARLIERRAVEGPSLAAALAAGARLGVRLSEATAARLLGDPGAPIRAGACRCVRFSPTVLPLLLALLDDLGREVAGAAACALGRAGRGEARPLLLRLLHEGPSEEVIDAVIAVADEECLVLLRRLARTCPRFAEAAREALDLA